MSVYRFLSRLGDRCNNCLANFTIVLFTVMTVIVWAQIFYRFVLGDGIVWAEEIAKYMMVWMALLGAAVVYYEKGHIAIEFLIGRVRCARWLHLINALLAAVLFAVLIYYGIRYAKLGLRLTSPASGIRRFWPYLAIPAGGLFLLLNSIIRVLGLIIEGEDGRKTPPACPVPKI